MTKASSQDLKTDVHSKVRDHYGQIAATVESDAAADCCGPAQVEAPINIRDQAETEAACCGESAEVEQAHVSRLYEAQQLADLPEEVTGLSLGCGDPVTLASLEPGQTVLDLGSGGGIDCFLAAKQVGPEGRVIGVDMTPEMLVRARANKAKLEAENVEFRMGEIEHLPVADGEVDVVISNCVINLSPDKPQVFREAFRTLRPGGRLAVSDIVSDGPLPDGILNDPDAWASCIAGALDVKDYVAAIEAAGFVDVEVKRVYLDRATIQDGIDQLGLSGQVSADDEKVAKGIFSAKVQALKPER